MITDIIDSDLSSFLVNLLFAFAGKQFLDNTLSFLPLLFSKPGRCMNSIDRFLRILGQNAARKYSGHILASSEISCIFKSGNRCRDPGLDFGYIVVPASLTSNLQCRV